MTPLNRRRFLPGCLNKYAFIFTRFCRQRRRLIFFLPGALIPPVSVAALKFSFLFTPPGVFLHEFSHILMAEMLRVPTGELKLKPEIKDGHLTLGSAQIAATDPLRLTLIGTRFAWKQPFFQLQEPDDFLRAIKNR